MSAEKRSRKKLKGSVKKGSVKKGSVKKGSVKKGSVKKASAKKKVTTRKVGKAPRKARQAQHASAPTPKARKGSPPIRAAVRREADVAGQPAGPPVEVVEVTSIEVVVVREPVVTS